MNELKKIKLLLIAFIAILTIVACEKDLYDGAIQQEKQINIKPISLEKFNSKIRQMKNRPEIERFMVSSRNGSALSRTESTSEFEIITDEIKEITQGDYTSYTMYLKTPDTTNNIYNITIEEIDGNSSFFITKYIPTTYWLENKDLPFDGEIITYRESNTNSSGANTLQEYLDLINGELYPSGGGGGGISGTGNNTSTSYPYDCNGIVYETTIVTEIKCGCGHNWQDLLTGVCDGCRDYLPKYPSLSTTTTYQCIPISSNPSGTGNTTGGNTLGGGGSGSGTSTGGTSTGAITGSITTIVDPTEECNAPRGDLNNDCILDDEESNFVTFLDNLSPEKKQLVNGDDNIKMTVFNYLVNQNWNIESVQFIEDALQTLCNGGNVDFTLQIILDPSFKNNPCLKGVYDTMIQNSPTANNYLNNFDSSMSVANLIFASSNTLSPTSNAVTNPPQNYLISITFNSNNLNRPELSIARTFIHELIHAEIFRKLLSISNHPSINLTLSELYQNKENFPGLYDYYSRYTLNTTQLSDPQHQMMAQHYRDIISDAIKEFDNNQHTQDIYDALAWVGLMGEGSINMTTGLTSNPTVAWQNLTQTQRINIINTVTTFESSNTNCQ